MDFCNVCGNRLVRQADGKLQCRNGHSVEDSVTRKMQENLEKKRREQEKRQLTFPDPERHELVVLRLKNPFSQPTGFRKAAGENVPTFKVYDVLTKMEEKYGPSEMRRILGSPWAEGAKENKFGIIICVKSLAPLLKDMVEQVDLGNGKKFTVEQVDVSASELKQRIEEAKQEILAKMHA
jgi:DNA-directed RNA polymerase subunit M/transcription elongation factor TFIIS